MSTLQKGRALSVYTTLDSRAHIKSTNTLSLGAALLTRWMSAGVISGIGLLIAAVGLYWLSVALRDGASPAAIAPLLTIGIGAGMPWD